jgi:hypothetical protein
MSNTFKKLQNCLSISIVVVLLNACAMGPIYQPAPEAPEGYGLLHLMRGDVYYNGGYATNFKINDVNIVDLYDFGYSWIHLKPGEYNIRAGYGRKQVNIEAGKAYYLEYHQENIQMPSGRINTSAVLDLYDYDKIQEQLSESRYKVAESLGTGKKAKRRYFKNVDIESGAKIRFIRKPSYKNMYPTLNAGLYDNFEECVDGYQAFEKNYLKGDYFNISTDKPISISTNLTDAIPDISLSCRNTFTFKPKAGKSYTIEIDVEKTSTQSHKDFCIVEVIDNESKQKMEVLSRTQPLQWTGYSPQCSNSDFKKLEWKDHSRVKFDCRIMFNRKWKDC